MAWSRPRPSSPILAGTVAGGALILFDNGTTLVAALGVGVAVLGLIGALFVPPSPPADPKLAIGVNQPLETWRVVRQATTIRPVWLSILGLSWFWVVGATLLTEFPTIVRDVLHAGGNAW